MRADLKINMYEKKLEKISNEIEVLMGQIREGVKTQNVSFEQIEAQLIEIQDFVNS